MKIQQINYLAVVAAAVATFMLGAAWYITLSEQWMSLTGLTEEKIVQSGGDSKAMIISFITYLLGAYSMATLFKAIGLKTWQTGAMTGALIGAFLIGGNIFSNNAYELKPIELSILNAGFSAVSCTVMGAILGAWRKYQ